MKGINAPPKRKNPTSGKTGRASYRKYCETNYNLSPFWFQHVDAVGGVIVHRIRSTPTTKPCHDRAQHWRGWLYRVGVL